MPGWLVGGLSGMLVDVGKPSPPWVASAPRQARLNSIREDKAGWQQAGYTYYLFAPEYDCACLDSPEMETVI